MHETKGKRVNGIKEKKRIKSLEGGKKTPASACLALYRCAAQKRHITEWKATRERAAL